MLNKKAIAAFAAGATLVSGLAIAAPALAVQTNGDSNVVQSNQATKLDNVVFNFKVGDKDHKTKPITLYKNGDKYGTEKSDINYTATQITSGLLAQVQNDLTPAQGDSVVDTGTIGTVTYPANINAGENTVTVAVTYHTDFKDSDVTAMADLVDFKTFEATLKQQKKKISPAQKALFDAERAKVTVTKLDNVVLNFKVGDKDHKTKPITLYKNGDKYGTEKSDINYTATQITSGLLAQVQNDLTPAQGDSVVDTGTIGTVTYPANINAGENTVTVAVTYHTDFKDSDVTAMADLVDFKTFEATLKQQKKKISPAQKALFDAERAKVEEAISKDKARKDALIAEAERFGLPKNVIDSLKDYAKYKESAAVAKLLEQGKKAAIEELAKKADAEDLHFIANLIRNSKKSTLTALKNLLKEAEIAKRHTNNAVAPAINNVPAYDIADLFKGLTYEQAKALYDEMNANAEAAKKDAKDGKLDADTVKLLAQAKAAFQKIVKATIEEIAKQAEKEGFAFAAKQIRNAKTVEGAQAVLDVARASKKQQPNPVVPPTPVPSAPQTAKGEALVQPELPELSAADLFKGLTYDEAKALYEEMLKNAADAGVNAGKVADRDNEDPTARLLAQAKAKIEQMAKDEIENIAKQAEKEGFTFVAKYIRKAKTVEGARALLAEAEKSKPVPPTPPTPPTPTTPASETSSDSPVSENESTTVDKGELNVQIKGAESDLAAAGNAAGVAQAKAALKAVLADAKKVAADSNATQAQVDAAARKLADARKALADAKAHSGESTGKNKLPNTGSAMTFVGMFAAMVAAAGVVLFAGKRRGVSRHCNM